MASPGLVRKVFALQGDTSTVDACLSRGIDVTEVSDAVMSRLAPTVNPRGPVAVIGMPEPGPPPRGNVLVLVELTDPGNVGTLIRSAAGFGWAVATTPGTADVWGPKVLRAGAGAHFTTSLSETADPLRDFGASGHRLVASVASGGTWPPDATVEPSAVLVGSEARGLPEEIIAGADERVTIPSDPQVESLNAAIAGAIIMYEFSRSEDP